MIVNKNSIVHIGDIDKLQVYRPILEKSSYIIKERYDGEDLVIVTIDDSDDIAVIQSIEISNNKELFRILPKLILFLKYLEKFNKFVIDKNLCNTEEIINCVSYIFKVTDCNELIILENYSNLDNSLCPPRYKVGFLHIDYIYSDYDLRIRYEEFTNRNT